MTLRHSLGSIISSDSTGSSNSIFTKWMAIFDGDKRSSCTKKRRRTDDEPIEKGTGQHNAIEKSSAKTEVIDDTALNPMAFYNLVYDRSKAIIHETIREKLRSRKHPGKRMQNFADQLKESENLIKECEKRSEAMIHIEEECRKTLDTINQLIDDDTSSELLIREFDTLESLLSKPELLSILRQCVLNDTTHAAAIDMEDSKAVEILSSRTNVSEEKAMMVEQKNSYTFPNITGFSASNEKIDGFSSHEKLAVSAGSVPDKEILFRDKSNRASFQPQTIIGRPLVESPLINETTGKLITSDSLSFSTESNQKLQKLVPSVQEKVNEKAQELYDQGLTDNPINPVKISAPVSSAVDSATVAPSSPVISPSNTENCKKTTSTSFSNSFAVKQNSDIMKSDSVSSSVSNQCQNADSATINSKSGISESFSNPFNLPSVKPATSGGNPSNFSNPFQNADSATLNSKSGISESFSNPFNPKSEAPVKPTDASAALANAFKIADFPASTTSLRQSDMSPIAPSVQSIHAPISSSFTLPQKPGDLLFNLSQQSFETAGETTNSLSSLKPIRRFDEKGKRKRK